MASAPSVLDSISSTATLRGDAPILFLSDLHFGDGSKTDLFVGQEHRFFRFLDEFRERVGTIVFLGDIFDRQVPS